MSFEERRPWLEGAEQPFLVLTDYNNIWRWPKALTPGREHVLFFLPPLSALLHVLCCHLGDWKKDQRGKPERPDSWRGPFLINCMYPELHSQVIHWAHSFSFPMPLWSPEDNFHLWTAVTVLPPQKVTPISSFWLTDFLHFFISSHCPCFPLPLVLQHVFCLHDFLMNVLFDQWPQFLTQFWRAFSNLYGPTVSLFPATIHKGTDWEAQSGLKTGIHCLTSLYPSSCSKLLIWVEYAHNTLPCKFTHTTPFQFVNGFYAPLFPALEKYVSVLNKKWQHLQKGCRLALYTSLLPTGAARVSGSTQRIIAGWILQVSSSFHESISCVQGFDTVAVRLKLPRSIRVYPMFHFSHLKPVKES